MDKWFLRTDGQESGPFTKGELVFLAKEGRLAATDEVRRGVSGPWRPANSVLKGMRRTSQEHVAPAVHESLPVSEGTAEARPETFVVPPPPLPSRSSSRLFSPLTIASGVGGLAVLLLLGGLVWRLVSGSDETVATTPPAGTTSPEVTPESGVSPVPKPGGGLPLSMQPMAGPSGKNRPGPDSEMIESLKGRDAQMLVSKAVGNVILGWRFVNKDGQMKETPFPMRRFVDMQEFEDLEEKGFRVRVLTSRTGKKVYCETLLSGGGSCFFVTNDGFALTNKHVVEEFEQVKRARTKIREMKKGWEFESLTPLLWVIVAGEPYEAAVKYSSESFDLAVIKIEVQNSPFFRLSTQEEPPLLTEVMAIGFPGAATKGVTLEDEMDFRSRLTKSSKMKDSPLCEQKITLTRGEVSSISNRPKIGQLIQHGASINPGNSGGPLWESKSRAIIGINTFKIHEADGVFFALQMQQMRTEIDEHVPGVSWSSPSDLDE